MINLKYRRNLMASAVVAMLGVMPVNAVWAAEKIDFGPFCGTECQSALTLKADPASIKGTVGVAIASLTFPYGVALKARTEAAAAKYFPGIKLIVGDGQNDPSVQTALVDNFITQGVDVIIINAVEKDALAPAVKRAMDAGIKVIAQNYADYDQAKGLQVMEDFLQRFPAGKIDAVFTHADIMTFGAIQAIEASGRQNEIKIVSIDGENAGIEKVAAGKMDSSVIYPVVAPMGIIAAAMAIAGEPLPKFIKLDAPTVTKENAAEFKGKSF